EKEELERYQSIVNDVQIGILYKLITELQDNAFYDSQKKYFILIDDLDKNWMPHDSFYDLLVKTLLETVREINHKFDNVKIIIAMRNDIYFRIFHKIKKGEPQREKWVDNLIELKWNQDYLKDFLDKRLKKILHYSAEKKEPSVDNILPNTRTLQRKGKKEVAYEYIIERTLLRPRDLVDFFNVTIEQSNQVLNLTWRNIEKAELEYSKSRLASIYEEWNNIFFGLNYFFPLLQKLGPIFSIEDIKEEDILEVLTHDIINECKWLKKLAEYYDKKDMNVNKIRDEIINTLYVVGLIGIKKKNEKTKYSCEHKFELKPIKYHDIEYFTIHVHKMLWKALKLKEKYV
ncbi:P-loop ATPase, Sll1717 family, partial [Bacteroidota bacterium]